MNSILLSDILRVTNGQAVGQFHDDDIPFVSTDTRQIRPESLFIAIRGENHDGHEFLGDAARNGAVAALVEEAPAVHPASLQLIRVANTRKALGQVAALVRQQFKGGVIAVGGSNGKTGTKCLIDSALRQQLKGMFSPKSFNNDIGVPLAIFPADTTDDYLVLELGTNHPGEMRPLTHIARPDIAVITNVAAEHLEGFGDMDGVRREESSIIEGLDPDGLVVVNGDDPLLLEKVASFPGKRITFGLHTANDLYPTHITCDLSGVRFRLNGRQEVFLPLLGFHVAVNALAAIAVAQRLGLADEQIIAALSTAHGPEMRLALQKVRGIALLNDAYNANPASMEAAIRTLRALPARGRHVAILGDMKELGETSDECHRAVGRYIAANPVDVLVSVGNSAQLIADESGLPADRIIRFDDTDSARQAVPSMLKDGDIVLLKGSRTMKLETIGREIESPEPARKAS